MTRNRQRPKNKFSNDETHSKIKVKKPDRTLNGITVMKLHKTNTYQVLILANIVYEKIHGLIKK